MLRTLLLSILLFAATISHSATLSVQADGTGEYPTIEAALIAAEFHDIIELGDGLFTGEGNRSLTNLNKVVTIRSASGNPSSCIIDCQGSSSDPHNFITLMMDLGPPVYSGWGLEGLTITGGWSDYGGAVQVMNYAHVTVSNCHFVDNVANQYGGGVYVYTAHLDIEDCIFTGNRATSGGGLYAMTDTGVFVERCTFVENAANWGGAISAGSILFINQSILAFSESGEALYWVGSKLGFNCSDAFGNAGGDYTGELVQFYGLNDNICEDPLFCDRYGGDYSLSGASPCVAEDLYCGPMGALGVGCGPVGNESMRWGDVKASYK